MDGNIGYHAAGRLPVRRGWQGDLPVDGASGQFEWDGYIPFDQLPSAFNPPSGMIVTANQNPFPAAYPYVVNGNFAAPYRSTQIRDMLAGRKKWRTGDMLAVQKDVYSGFGRFLAQSMVAAYDRRKVRNPGVEEAVSALRGWNGQVDKDGAAPLIVALAYPYVRKAAAECAAPGKGAAYDYQMSTAALEQLLRTRPPGWFPDYDQVLLRALADAIEEGRRMTGSPVSKWRYGDFVQLTLANPVVHEVPLLGKYFDIGPVPMSGGPTTVKQLTRHAGWLGPSMRMTADLGDWERSLLNIPIGQSGQVLSSHFKDEWERYYVGESFPMQYGKIDEKSVLELVPER